MSLIRVLLVDDSKLTHKYLTEILVQSGMLVCGHAYNGVDAVQGYMDTAPDVVVMDILMPRLDGIGAIREIRGLDPDARIVVLTSLDQPSVLERAIHAGAYDYAIKPSQPKKLVRVLKRAALGRVKRSRSSLQLSQALIDVTAEILPDFAGFNALHATTNNGPWPHRVRSPHGFQVQFKGTYKGILNFCFDRKIARAILKNTVPDAVDDPELQQDSMAELANIITGRAARFLETVHGRIQFKPPQPIQNLQAIQRIPPLCRIATEAGAIEISLGTHKTKKRSKPL